MKGKWTRIGLLVVGASLVGALVLGGVALAQAPDNGDNGATTVPCWGMGWGGHFGGIFGFFGGMHGGHMMGGPHIGGWGLDIVAAQLGMTPQELVEALSDGETTVADLAEQQGVELQTIVDAILAPMADHLAVMVNYGRLTQTEADQMLALMEARLTRQFTTPRTAYGPIATVAAQLGMTPQELVEALSDGETTVADLAEQQGVELQTIVDALLAPLSDHLAIEIEYGRLTQAQADAILERAETALTQALSQPYAGRFGGFKGNGFRGGPFNFRFNGHGPRMNGMMQQPLFRGFSF